MPLPARRAPYLCLIVSLFVAGKYLKKYEERKRASVLATRRFRSKLRQLIDFGAMPRAPRRAADGPDEHYGLQVEARVDDPATLQQRMQETRQRLEDDLNDREAILQLPQKSREWKEARSLRLTACNFAAVCRRRDYTSCKHLVRDILYKNMGNEPKTQAPAIAHGIKYEPVARNELAALLGVTIEESGLVISRTAPHLGASPGKHLPLCRPRNTNKF